MLNHLCRVSLHLAFFWILSLFPGLGMATETIRAEAPAFSGPWVNDRGSVVHLSPSDGLLTGFYQTNVGQPNISQRFPLTGFIQGDLITFSVNFTGYGSMTTWAGQLSEDSDGPFLRTLWHLTRDIEDEMEDADLWRSITAGASNFRPLSNPPLPNQ